MMESILIANRGEIACRIIRTCRRLGIRSIAVYSDADADALHVELADEAIYLGGSSARDSYLNIDALVAAARRTSAQAIHPGYGFLSENEAFARRLKEEGIVFIGPHPEAIAAMGSKSQSKILMRKHGVPLVPGYEGEDQSLARFMKEADAIGYPVLLKAAAGGGGKGMRIVHDASSLQAAMEGAKREALNAFGNDELLIEKYFESARHIEFQVFGDRHGNTVHLFERECSIQRRYQKVFEESPSPVLSDEKREEMGRAAVQAAAAIGYDNAGTVEFIYAPAGDFYFLEMNTRLQVEHPVTEAITGLDLVEWQIRVAQGETLPLRQEEIQRSGYALECRLYAEDANQQFLPDTGRVLVWDAPELEGLRYDTGVRSGSEIGIHYDPMIAKVIAHGDNRGMAIRRMQHALRRLVCLGLTTNQEFLLEVLEREDFRHGDYDTHYIANRLDGGTSKPVQDQDLQIALQAATAYGWLNRQAQKPMPHLPSGWRNIFFAPQQQQWIFNEEVHTVLYRAEGRMLHFGTADDIRRVEVIGLHAHELILNTEGHRLRFAVAQSGDQVFVQLPSGQRLRFTEQSRYPEKEKENVKGGYLTPMPAQVVKVLVENGQEVKKGQSLLILVSMKMENTIAAVEDGIVEEIYVSEGMNLEAGKLLLKMKSES